METQLALSALAGFADRFWKNVGTYRRFAFHGEMGAGKTTLIAALCRAKGVTEGIGSPTFSIINEYTYWGGGGVERLYHMDLYRLKSEEEAAMAGVEDCLYSGRICLVEWPEKAPGLFDEKTVQVFISVIDNDERLVKITLPSESVEEQS
jgi:tRNA threonylcarbamoyladenosine biosynthesis protein TsaE